MEALPYALWPFRSPADLTPEEASRWWEVCYVPGPLEGLGTEPYWQVLLGGPRSGKTVALLAIARREAEHALLIPYPPDRWPGASREWVPGGNHLAQMMSGAALVLRDLFFREPERIFTLSDLQKEFLRWLMEKYLGPRAFRRWIEGLPPEYTEALSRIPSQDLFPTTSQPLDVQGQIDELVNLARRLGYSWIRVLIDFDPIQARKHREAIRRLIGEHDLMLHPGFRVTMSLPRELWNQEQLARIARGRIGVIPLSWTREQAWEIALRHLRAACGDPSLRLADWIAPTLQQDLEAWLQEQYGGYAPAGWVGLIETVLHLTTRGDRRLRRPLRAQDFREVVRTLCARHLPLRLDLEARGVWRGPRFIPLADQPLNLLKALWERQGGPVDASDERVRVLLGPWGATKANLHTLAARIRRQIEPFPDQPVYLINRRGEGGYYLEHFIEKTSYE